MKIYIFLLFLSSVAYSQVNFGVKAGIGLSTLQVGSSYVPEPEIKKTFTGGVFSEYRFNNIGIELNVAYIDAGHRGNIDYRDDPSQPMKNHEYILSLKKINVEAYLKYRPIELVAVKVGGFYGFIVDKDNSFPLDQDNFAWVKRQWKNNDAGIALAAEIYITKSIFAEAKYLLGLVDLQTYKHPVDEWEFDPIVNEGAKNGFEARSRFISLNVGYKFL